MQVISQWRIILLGRVYSKANLQRGRFVRVRKHQAICRALLLARWIASAFHPRRWITFVLPTESERRMTGKLKPETALRLVYAYSEWNREIKRATALIRDHLGKCLDARIERVETIGSLKNGNPDSHLSKWYTPIEGSREAPDDLLYEKITHGIHGKECEHCYQAHLAVQSRKKAKKELGHVKGVMSKSLNRPND
jgi:hypothetical protein